MSVFRKKAALFGVQAPNPWLLAGPHVASLVGFPHTPLEDWNFQYTPGSSQINLDASYPGLAPATDGEPRWIVLTSPEYTALFQVTAAAETGPQLYTLTAKTTRLTLANGQVLVSNVEAVYEQAYAQFVADVVAGKPVFQDFLNLLQAYEAYVASLGALTMDQVLAEIVGETRSATAYVQSVRLATAELPYIAWAYDGTYARQAGLLKPVEGATLEIVGGQQLGGGRPVGVSGRRLRLQVASGTQASFVPDGATGSLAVSDGQAFLVDAFPPAADPSAPGTTTWRAITLGGIAGALRTPSGNVTLVPSDKDDAVVGEAVTLDQASVAGSITTLSFDRPLARIYDRSTVAVNANVVAATQGETMHEILGSGDATDAALAFTLKQGPLTYVSAPRGLGASSTLEVWVNNLRWHEVDNLLASGPADRVFVTGSDPKGGATVQFGDGVRGARTPTGTMNIRAVYRKGLGAAGNVQAGQLSLALDRPQGLKGVTNPDPATGGADPDPADGARTSAPLHVRTLDRVVSLEDYQDYALAFAGIAKALATWTWFGRTRGIFLTVAGADGTVFREDDLTVVNLLKALRGAGNPYLPIRVASYIPVSFEVSANVRIDQFNYDADLVLGQVWQSLATSFAFSRRALGQGVAQGEVLAAIQQTPGVIAATLAAFNRQGEPAVAPLPAVLRAASPRAGQDGTPKAAEMLLLDPGSQGNIGVWS